MNVSALIGERVSQPLGCIHLFYPLIYFSVYKEEDSTAIYVGRLTLLRLLPYLFLL
jgi:hypothetical protein